MKRTNEAFAAEVYRRSEETIKANKKRRRVLLTTLPTAVCLLAISVAVLPGLMSERMPGTVSTMPSSDKTVITGGLDDDDADEGSLPAHQNGAGVSNSAGLLTDDAADDTIYYSVARCAEVYSADGESRASTEPEHIAELENCLPGRALEMALRGDSVALKGAGDDSAGNTARGTYRFVLTAEDGTRYGFRLWDDTLYIENVNTWITISPEDTAALQEALGRFLTAK